MGCKALAAVVALLALPCTAQTDEFHRWWQRTDGESLPLLNLTVDTQALNGENLDLAHEVAGVLEERTDAMEKSLRLLHIQRLNEGLCAPASGVIFIDIITNLERIGDHATNVAEIILAMHGEAQAQESGVKHD